MSLTGGKPSRPDGAVPRRILITGAAGFLGTVAAERLLADPGVERVVGVDLQPAGVRLEHGDRMVPIVRDIRGSLRDILVEHGIQAVVHLAFLLRPSRNSSQARAVNVEATKTLLEACSQTGVRSILYLSSATVYGAHPGFSRPRTEEDPVNPVRGFQYSEDKVAAERLMHEYAAAHPGIAVCILRGCVIMAAGADNFISRSLGRRLLPVPAGGDPEMQFLHAYDYASALDAVLRGGVKGVFNIAGRGTVRWREMASLSGARLLPAPAPLLAAVVNISWRLRLQSESPASGLSFIRYPWLVSTEKIKRELGWSPRFSSLDAVQAWATARPGN